MEDNRLTQLLLLWLGAVFVIVLARGRRKTVGTGLVLAYLFNLWLIHWVAPALYLLPGYENYDPHIVEAGLEQSLYAILAFVAGSLFIAPFLMSSGIVPRSTTTHDPDPNRPMAYVWTGVVSYTLLNSALGQLPTATALIAAGQQLIVVGLSLCCWKAWNQKDFRKLAAWLG